MTSSIKVSEIMTKSVVVGNADSSFTQIMEFFTEHGIQHLPIEEKGSLIGIISLNDMAGFIFAQARKGGNLHALILDALFSVKNVMTPKPITVTPDDKISKAVGLLADGRFQALPVVNNGELQGIISNKDLIRMLHWEYTH